MGSLPLMEAPPFLHSGKEIETAGLPLWTAQVDHVLFGVRPPIARPAQLLCGLPGDRRQVVLHVVQEAVPVVGVPGGRHLAERGCDQGLLEATEPGRRLGDLRRVLETGAEARLGQVVQSCPTIVSISLNATPHAPAPGAGRGDRRVDHAVQALLAEPGRSRHCRAAGTGIPAARPSAAMPSALVFMKC